MGAVIYKWIAIVRAYGVVQVVGQAGDHYLRAAATYVVPVFDSMMYCFIEPFAKSVVCGELVTATSVPER